MYYHGRGVPRDYVLAHMWFILGATGPWRGEAREQAIKGRDEMAKSMTPAQITEARRLAREWKPKRE